MSALYTKTPPVLSEEVYLFALLSHLVYMQHKMLASPAACSLGTGLLHAQTLKDTWRRQRQLKATSPQQRHKPTEQGQAVPLRKGIRVNIFAAHQIEEAPSELRWCICGLASVSPAVRRMGKQAGEDEMAGWHLSSREATSSCCEGAWPLTPKWATQSWQEPSTTSTRPSREPEASAAMQVHELQGEPGPLCQHKEPTGVLGGREQRVLCVSHVKLQNKVHVFSFP